MKSPLHISEVWMCRLGVRAAVALVGVVTFASQPGSAQNADLAVGYSVMRGRIGDVGSDRGFAGRAGLQMLGGSHLAWSVEGGVDRLDEDRNKVTTTCYSVGRCHFDIRNQDTGWSLGTILRVYPAAWRPRLYGLIGLGYLRVNTHQVQSVVDDAGNPLTNFNFDFTSGSDLIQVHVGAGVVTWTKRLPVGLFLEARATRLFYNYSGGLAWSWNPSLVVGIRTGRRR